MKKLLLVFTIISLSMGAMMAVKAQSISEEAIKAQLVKDWERAKAFTDEYMAIMPADKYSFKAQDSIRSYAQQLLHLASTNIFLMGAATDAPPPPLFSRGLENRKSAQTKDSVSYIVNESYDYCIAAIKALPANKWGETKKIFSFTETRFTLLLKAFEHQTHHRGQATIYIRTAGYKPPNEKLF